MNTYKILHKDTLVIAVEISTTVGREEFTSLAQQGFTVVDGEFDAKNKQEAINQYYANTYYSQGAEFSLTNMLFFKTNQLSRLPYLCINLGLACIVVMLFYIIIGNIGNVLYGQVDIGFGAVVFLLIFCVIGGWVSLSASVARWKNRGHQGWYYLLALIGALVLDLVTMGIASVVLALYLLFAPAQTASNA